jgi:hypothetical protein
MNRHSLAPRTRRHVGAPAAIAGIALAALALTGCEAVGAGDDFSAAYEGYLNKCASCHAPDAAGKGPGTETSLDFSTEAAARASIQGGNAAGLTGNFAGCNGTPFVVAGNPDQSLIIAVLDEDVRQNFDLSSHSGCNKDSISDMTKWVGGPDADAIAKLKAWVQAGAL